MKERNPIWNTFHARNFFQMPTALNLVKDSSKTDLNGLWSDWLSAH
jgi:hypothetical protein